MEVYFSIAFISTLSPPHQTGITKAVCNFSCGSPIHKEMPFLSRWGSDGRPQEQLHSNVASWNFHLPISYRNIHDSSSCITEEPSWKLCITWISSRKVFILSPNCPLIYNLGCELQESCMFWEFPDPWKLVDSYVLGIFLFCSGRSASVQRKISWTNKEILKQESLQRTRHHETILTLVLSFFGQKIHVTYSI